MKISVVTPVYNEAKNIPILIDEIQSALSHMHGSYEIIAVNDGSKDDSFKVLKNIASKNKHLKVINFGVNVGQTGALSAGIDMAKGEMVALIDSDLENDPKDIPVLMKKIEEGFDVVSGWRKDRWSGSFLKRKLPSLVANSLISKITGLKLHDYGCILKVYKKEVIEGVHLYGEMHRFIPAYAASRGAKVSEMVVNYRPRVHGKSNYGLGRTFKVLLDLIVIKFLDKYMNKPMHFFGGIGFVSFAVGTLSGTIAIILRLVWGLHLVQTPLPIFSALFIIVGIQLIVMGIIAEMLMRTYYESQGKKSYFIKETVNF